jgi:general nucleoside transport system permease protein
MPDLPSDTLPPHQGINFETLDRLVRRFERIFLVLAPCTAVVTALILIGVMIISLGQSPFIAYQGLFVGAFGTLYDTANTLNRATPLILAGLGLALAYRGGVFNIGGDGQIMMGGLTATLAGIYLQNLPIAIHLPLTLLAGFIGGAIWGLIPGYAFAKYGTNLVITTIMLNSIAAGINLTLVNGPLQDPSGSDAQSAVVQLSARLPLILPGTRLHAGIILAVLTAVILYIVLFHMPFGYEIRAVGQNKTAARHAGINVFRTQILLMVISGGLAGLAGSAEILGAQYRLRDAFLPSYGYDAIAVALLGQTNPFGVIISGLFFGALLAGAGSMQRATNLPMSLVSVTSGVIILFVTASIILTKLPRYLAKRGAKEGSSGLFKKRGPDEMAPEEADHVS